MPRKSPYSIILTADEKSILEARARKYTSPYSEVVRAKIILLASAGLENQHIGERLSIPRQIVYRWRKRFFQERLPGLDERAGRGRPRSFSPSRGRGNKSASVCVTTRKGAAILPPESC